jgi:hypothetical protein
MRPDYLAELAPVSGYRAAGPDEVEAERGHLPVITGTAQATAPDAAPLEGGAMLRIAENRHDIGANIGVIPVRIHDDAGHEVLETGDRLMGCPRRSAGSRGRESWSFHKPFVETSTQR